MTIKIGDRIAFVYPKEPQFNCLLTITGLREGLVFYSDGSHGRQSGLVVALSYGTDSAHCRKVE